MIAESCRRIPHDVENGITKNHPQEAHSVREVRLSYIRPAASDIVLRKVIDIACGS